MPSILVAGSAVIDFVFVLDEMPRLAAKYHAHDANILGGGCSANAAAAIARLAGRAIFVGGLGDDQIADMIVSGLEREGVDCSGITRIEGHRSSFSSVFLDAAGERQIVNYRDEFLASDVSWPFSSQEEPLFDAVLADARWAGLAGQTMRLALARGVPAVLDVESPIVMKNETMRLATHIGFSVEGLAECAATEDVERGLRIAHEKLGAFVCVTCGERGTYHLDEHKIVVHTPAFDVRVVDSLAAGDVWHGAFTLALAEGRNESTAVRFANAVAALKCTRMGGRAGYPSRQEVERLLAKNSGQT